MEGQEERKFNKEADLIEKIDPDSHFTWLCENIPKIRSHGILRCVHIHPPLR